MKKKVSGPNQTNLFGDDEVRNVPDTHEETSIEVIFGTHVGSNVSKTIYGRTVTDCLIKAQEMLYEDNNLASITRYG